MRTRGFTLIELLIVVALIGILAVALLSAINPIEQARKARDAGRKSDAAELLNAYERYYSTYGCYPWARAGGVCGNDTLAGGASFNPNLGAGGESLDLITIGEVKAQFATRTSLTDPTVAKRLYVTETSAGAVSVCAEPESTNGRGGGLGPTKDVTNINTATCTGSYPNQSCYVCVPQ